MSETPNEIIVIGAGVVGLTTALKIQEKGGCHVTIIAETLPTDPKTSRYTSHWAGAQHATSADSPGVHSNQLEMDKETFRIMWDLSAPGSDAAGCFMRLRMISYAGYQLEKPSVWEFMPDFKYLTEEERVPTMVDGSSFTTVTIDVPVYLNYLFSRFLSKGGAAVKGQVQHVKQVIEGGAGVFTGAKNCPKPVAVVVCAGLGARFLGGVEDKDMYPIRGQTIIVRAPWVKEMPCFHLADGAISYVIPRRSGDVIIGGTFLVDDWYPTARSDTKREILERVIKLYPNIAPPEVRAVREPTVADLEAIVIEDGCGLRPGRKGGVRLEVDSSGSIPLVFNYGHGGYGYQSSWGTAGAALKLLKALSVETTKYCRGNDWRIFACCPSRYPGNFYSLSARSKGYVPVSPTSSARLGSESHRQTLTQSLQQSRRRNLRCALSCNLMLIRNCSFISLTGNLVLQ